MDSYDALADGAIVAVADDAAQRIAARVAHGALAGDALLGACVDDLRTSGYLTLTVPRAFGGLGGSVLDTCIAQEKVSAALGSAGLAANMHLQYIGGSLVSGLWPPEMLEAFLRGVVKHGWLVNNCQAEAEMGSPARGGLPGTTATRTDGGWRLTGRKGWSTASTFLTHYATSATVQADGIPPHIGQFLVTADSPGVRVEPSWHALAMRESASHDIVLDNVFVPDDRVIRVSPDGTPYAASIESAPWHGLPFAATYVGVAVAARNWVAHFAATRIPTHLGHPIGDLPSVRARLGEIEALLFAARRLVFDVARDWVEEKIDRRTLAAQVPLAKYVATNNAVAVTDLALRIAGGAGLADAEPLERCFRDVRAGLIHPPMDDMTLNGAATRALKEFGAGKPG